MSDIKSDIQIAREAKMQPINDILAKINVPDENHAFSPMGRHIAKINLGYLNGLKNKDGKLILVTAITPTPAGEGKTTTSVGLNDGLNKIGKKSIVCLREPSWAYSNNSALCVLDFLINGMKVDIDDLDIASFQAAASTCDDNITIINSSGTSTTEKRYTTNGVAFLDEEVISTLEQLLIPCHGSLLEEGGTIRLLVPGASTTVTANLTEDDLISELSIKVNAQISSRMNKVGGSFTSAQENYQEVDFSPISSSSLIADDGREHIHELSLAMVTSESHAQRMASIVLKENALTNSINATLKPEFAYLRVGDIVTMTFQPEVIGGSGTDSILTNATKFQVVSYSLQPTGEISVELQEYNDSSYVWNTADHDYVTRTALADSFIETIDKPTFGTPVASNYLDEAGNQVLAFNVPLTPASHPNFAFTSVGLSRIGVASNGVETGIDLVEGKRAGPEDDNLKFSNLSTQIEPGHVNTYVSYKFKLFGRT